MGAKTSQLQIRISERQKAVLKRLAADVGLSVSEYVLSRALPNEGGALSRAVEQLAIARGPTRAHFEVLTRILSETPADHFHESLASLPIDGLNPILKNQVAGLVEQAAHTRRLRPPAWVREVTPPPRPHFGWPLTSLRPHQIRVTPVPFKRRSIFFDPASRRGVATPPPDPSPWTSAAGEPNGRALVRLVPLNTELSAHELKVEFYLVGGALLFQAFRARPATAHVSGLFAPAAPVAGIVRALAEREGWPEDWLPGAIKDTLAPGTWPDAYADRYVEATGLAAFVPPAEYVLALKVAALRVDAGTGALDDIRYLVRTLNLSSAAAALEITGRYFGARQVVAHAEALLAELLHH